ncbi:MAG: quinoprotein dehydrogenase-associated SoxYZ-like carrier [Gammaproteobacteria bacterium]
MKYLLTILLTLAIMPFPLSAAEDESVWNNALKNRYFAGKTIEESDDVIELDAPYRAEDPALVPVKVISKIPQTPDKYIKTITLLIDKNPVPFVGEFGFTPASGKADLAMRVRVNNYSYLRAIAEMNDGKLFMAKKFIKASGGCSAPIGADLDAAMQRLGKMKFRLDDGVKTNQPTLAQLLISHPNITGLQMDQVTRHIRPAHYVEKVDVFFNDRPILSAKTDIAISADPNFRFYFVPNEAGELRAEITDTNGQSFSQSYKVAP